MAGQIGFTLPAPRPVEGGLLRAALPFPDSRWTRGVKFNSSECLDGLPFPFCNLPDSPVEKTSQNPSEVETFDSFGIIVTVDCTTLGSGDPAKYAEQGLDVKREYVVAVEFSTGLTTNNPSLADATGVGTGSGIVEALALLEDEIADAIGGRLALIHVSPGNGVLLAAASAIRFSEGQWRTPSGHIVVISPGYHDLVDLHATGDVYAGTAGTTTLSSVDRTVNQRFATAEELGLAVFDPCFNISVTVGS